MKSIIYLKEECINKDRVFGSSPTYFPANLIEKNGTKVPALFTYHEIQRAQERARKNLEDLPKEKSWLSRLFG